MGRAASAHAALRLAGEGAHIVLTYASRRDDAEATADEVRQLGRKALAVRCNVAVPAEVEELVKQTHANLGPISFLVHSGAISNLADHAELTYDRCAR